jgi:hypothetical protein
MEGVILRLLQLAFVERRIVVEDLQSESPGQPHRVQKGARMPMPLFAGVASA